MSETIPPALSSQPGDPAALVALERDAVSGELVGGIGSRASKHRSGESRTRPSIRRGRWLAAGVALVLVATAGFAVTRGSGSSPGSTMGALGAATSTAASPADSTAATSPVTTVAGTPATAGPLDGFEGEYDVSIDELALAATSGQLEGATTRLVPAEGAVEFSYVNGANSGSATVPVERAPLVVTGCGQETCALDYRGIAPVLLNAVGDQILVVSFVDLTPVGREFCGLAGPADAGVVVAQRDAGGIVSSFSYVTSVGSGFGGADGCGSVWVGAYRVVATRR